MSLPKARRIYDWCPGGGFSFGVHERRAGITMEGTRHFLRCPECGQRFRRMRGHSASGHYPGSMPKHKRFRKSKESRNG